MSFETQLLFNGLESLRFRSQWSYALPVIIVANCSEGRLLRTVSS